jgi:methyl-accepting chemotaxis protein
MEIRRHIRIPIGWIAHVQTPLMGQPVINILPPSGQIVGQIPQEELKFHPIDGEAEIRGKLVNPLEQILDPEFMVALEKTTTQIGTLAEALTPAANAVTDLLQKRTIAQVESPDASEDMTANLYTAVERLHNVLMHVETVLGDPENQSNVQLLLENFRVASEDVRKAATGLNEFINEANVAATQASESMVSLNKTMLTSRERIDQIARKLMRNSDELSDILQHINSAARDVAEGKGTIGLLLRESEFHESLLLTVQRLGRAADELLVLIKQWQEKGILSRGN